MPPPRFLASNPAVRATTTAVSLIWQSKIMTGAIVCEAIAAIAAVLNWVTDFWWLANAALTLATFGAVAVACRVAWDYHGRGLNAHQTHQPIPKPLPRRPESTDPRPITTAPFDTIRRQSSFRGEPFPASFSPRNTTPP